MNAPELPCVVFNFIMSIMGSRIKLRNNRIFRQKNVVRSVKRQKKGQSKCKRANS